jgi:hypothetical protein
MLKKFYKINPRSITTLSMVRLSITIKCVTLSKQHSVSLVIVLNDTHVVLFLGRTSLG